MYKMIGSLHFSSFMFNEEIDEKFNNCLNKFIKELESSILREFVFDVTEPSFSFTHGEQEFLKDLLKPSHGFPLNMDKGTGLELLVVLLNLKIEEYLRVPLKNFGEQKQNNNKKSIPSFKDYLSNNISDANSLLEDQINDIEKIEVDGLNFPQYFLYNKARNIVASKLKKNKYSIKALQKFFKNINEDFEDYLYGKIIEIKLKDLKIHNKKEIYVKLEEELLKNFLTFFRLGKTEKEGEKLVIKVRKVIKDEQITEFVKEKLWDSFDRELGEGDPDELLVAWTKTFKEELKRQFDILELEGISENTEFYPYPMSKKNIKKIVLSVIFNKGNYVDLINSTFKRIKDDDKTQFVQRMNERYLKTGKFSVAICVNNVKTDDVYFNSNLISDVTVMSREMFRSWQYQLYSEDTESKMLVDNSDMKNATWFVVNGIKCAVSDNHKAYSLAIEKVRDLLNFLYHFISREDQIDYEIVDPYIIVNHTNKTQSIGRAKQRLEIQPKNIDDLENGLLEFTTKFFDNHNNERRMVQNAINYYIKVGKTDCIEEKMSLLASSCKTILGTSDFQKLSVYCAIIVAGVNYYNDDLTYGKMRRWLIDDFREFFTVTEKDGLIPLKKQILERFKAFSKIIIRTILFNLIPVNKESNNNVQKMLEWILVINPNEDNIVRRDN